MDTQKKTSNNLCI